MTQNFSPSMDAIHLFGYHHVFQFLVIPFVGCGALFNSLERRYLLIQDFFHVMPIPRPLTPQPVAKIQYEVCAAASEENKQIPSLSEITHFIQPHVAPYSGRDVLPSVEPLPRAERHLRISKVEGIQISQRERRLWAHLP